MNDKQSVEHDDPQHCWDDMTEFDDPEEDTNVAD